MTPAPPHPPTKPNGYLGSPANASKDQQNLTASTSTAITSICTSTALNSSNPPFNPLLERFMSESRQESGIRWYGPTAAPSPATVPKLEDETLKDGEKSPSKPRI